MSRKDSIIMSPEELRRASMINQALSGLITQKKASEVMGVSERQVRRLIKRVRDEGDVGIIHRLSGKPSNRSFDDKMKAEVIEFYKEKYWDFGPTFTSEKLYGIDGISINHETLRLWLITDNKYDWQRKGRKHRRWRERKEYFGEMVQMDGSHHDWLEGRCSNIVLMGYVDDATSTVFARFYDYEGTIPAMDSFMRYSKEHGFPQSIYLDRHTTYKSTRKQTIEEQLRNEMPMSQFERAMKELGVMVIHANSPQAKGRIERLFGTFQDRLIKEMRLAGIKSKEEANEFLERYLPEYNRRFSIPPTKEGDLHREVPGEEELKKILCIQTKRCLRNDATIRHNNRFYQIEGITGRIKTVIVEEGLDGSMRIRNNGAGLKYKEIDPDLITKIVVSKKKEVKGPRKVYIPPKDHPWRRFKI